MDTAQRVGLALTVLAAVLLAGTLLLAFTVYAFLAGGLGLLALAAGVVLLVHPSWHAEPLPPRR